MSNQDIAIVKEFNTWRRGDSEMSTDQGYPLRLGDALDQVARDAERYEFLRTLTPVEFTRLWQNNIHGRGAFDDLVDALIKERK